MVAEATDSDESVTPQIQLHPPPEPVFTESVVYD